VFLSCFVILSQAVYAAAIKVEGDAPLKSVAVIIESATLSNVVNGLSNKYGFEVKGREMLNDSQPFSAHISGSLRSVLEKVLRYCNNCSYIILPGPNEVGVGKLIILKSPHGPGTPQDRTPNPTQSASPLFG
jgi:hypothetical protein